MKKKIVILVLHLGVGGVEKVVSSIANILCNKYDVKIISTYKLYDTPAFNLNERIEIEYLLEKEKPNKSEFINAVKQFKLFKIFKEGYKSIKILILKRITMIKAIKNLDSDIVISTRFIYSKWLGKYGDKKIIKIAQEHNHHNNDRKYINKIVKSLKQIDYFMPTSKELTDFYSNILINTKTKLVYIKNSLDFYTDKIATLNSKNIISVGRLSEEKGFKDLIDVFEIVLRTYPDWNLKIVGDGTQYNELNEKIKQSKLENSIELCGFKTKDALNDLYLNSSIYVMTSYTESFGLVLVEAESYGLPIVVFDSAQGAQEIVEDEVNGYFVMNRDKNEMARKIIKLIENENLRKNMGNEGRKLSNNFRKEEISKTWYNFIDSCEKQK